MPDRRGGVQADVPTTAIVAGAVLAAMAVLAVFRIAPTTITALTIGVLLALALDPLVRAVQGWLRVSRAMGAIVVGLGLASVLAAIVLVLGPQAADQAAEFADELPATVEQLYSWPVVGDRLERADAIGAAERFVDDLPERFDADTVTEFADRVLGNVGTILLVLLTAVGVLLDGESLVARVRRAVPPARRDRADELGRIVYGSIARYFAGSLTVAALNGLVILTVGLVLGIPLAPLAAIWAAITNLIPQIGGFLGGAFFVTLAATEGAVPGVIALAVFLAYQQFENHVIQPTIIGRAVDLTPPTTMLVALIGGAAAGVPGALVATPLVGAFKSIWMDVRPSDDEQESS